MNIGRNIKKCRLLKKITQKQMSEILDINIRTYQKYESGDITPNMDTLKRIADALNVEIDVLIHWNDILDEDPNVSMFLARILDLKNFDNYMLKYSNLLNLTPDSQEFLTFINGTSANKDLYLKIADILMLSEDQLYNWVLYNVLSSTINQDIFNDSDIIKIMPRLYKQDIDDLIANGLSDKNRDLAQIILKVKYDTIEFERKEMLDHLEKVQSKGFEFDALKTLLRSIHKSYIIDTLNSDQFDYLLTKVQELLEFELFKIEKENTDSKNEN